MQLEVRGHEVGAVIGTYYPNADFSAFPCVPESYQARYVFGNPLIVATSPLAPSQLARHYKFKPLKTEDRQFMLGAVVKLTLRNIFHGY